MAQGQEIDSPTADTHTLKVPRPGMLPWWGWLYVWKFRTEKIRGQSVDISKEKAPQI